jgi:hypothetical protein
MKTKGALLWGLNEPWSVEDAQEFVRSWAPRVRGWMCILTSHDLVDVLCRAMEEFDRTTFAPVSCVQKFMNVRLAGDGPANWTCHLVVSRPKSLARWGALPGAYVGPAFDPGENLLDRSRRAVPGGKPVWLMGAVVRDYTREDDVIADPFMGGGTTPFAARAERRRCLGIEKTPETFAFADARMRRGHTPDLFSSTTGATE